MNSFFLYLSLLANLIVPPAQAATLDTTTIQNSLQTVVVSSTWPVKGTSMSNLEATFGPRIKVSTKAYDFHRGVDIKAALGTPVLAAVDGKLLKVDTYPDGGKTIILSHTFPSSVSYAGKKLTTYYTFYMHLNSVDPAIQAASNAKQHPIVKAGQVIGTVGHSGSGAVGDHLHFELRVGTYCTLEFQLANPASSCSIGYGFDPAMHALWLFPEKVGILPSISMLTAPTALQDGIFNWSNIHEQPVLNRIELYPTGSNTAVSVLDLNTRTGFDAKTTSALDKPTMTVPYFSPLSFSTSTVRYATNIVIPKSFYAPLLKTSQHYTLKTTNIWGRVMTYTW